MFGLDQRGAQQTRQILPQLFYLVAKGHDVNNYVVKVD